ncbi:hypothetical protein GLE_0674 [Lysobacter enzymogenes]|uniref:Uncharacterized protein n=1 Tax=Lysobacter enzymogenes TaxID=69 RepID=A0A0S2DBZ0_LYSEN|nr:hypothetical protein GLE_0674 [Lysobacter enzymogenes]
MRENPIVACAGGCANRTGAGAVLKAYAAQPVRRRRVRTPQYCRRRPVGEAARAGVDRSASGRAAAVAQRLPASSVRGGAGV